jgi:DNA repair protein RecN (Recombination protein N)
MLKNLHIRNYAIIKEVSIAFDHKLNIITGETGAGKSILMGALGLILGDRADTKSLLNADDKCVIEGEFDIKGYHLHDFFSQNELDYDTNCIIRRELSPAGKSRAFINDTPVSLQLLKELGSQLVDIVSQHQTLDLNNSSFQLSIVDAIAGTQADIDNYTQTYKQYKQTEKQLQQLIEQEAKAKQDEDYLNFILNELQEANPIASEQEELEANLEVLSHAESIQQAAGTASVALNGGESSIIDALNDIKAQLAQTAKHHHGIQELSKRIDSVIIELKDVATELDDVAENTQSNPQELERIESRLQLLFNLQKKHRVANNQELIDFMQSIAEKVKGLNNLTDDIANAQQTLETLRKQLDKQAETLTKKRTAAIPNIEKNVNELLVRVQMPDARIKVKHNTANQFLPQGLDDIELQFAANKGSEFQPIHKVASGGELSRLMLCIKSLISDSMALPTIVFDEIDTGISGEAALKVGNVMQAHATKHQVIAITHLPQIAGKATNHLFVHKTTDAHTTHTHIKTLSETERIEEIARMLHGANPSEKVLEAARELIG